MHHAREGFAQELGLAEGDYDNLPDPVDQVPAPVVGPSDAQVPDEPRDACAKEGNGKKKEEEK
jgi:hypothetical protein